jgi:hypothetical protein
VHTATETFAAAFNKINEDCHDDNELSTTTIENFLIAEALKAGVVKTHTKRSSINLNPNRWAKHLAPWFEETCRQDKASYKRIKRTHGKKSTHTKQAYQTFKNSCKHQRAQL